MKNNTTVRGLINEIREANGLTEDGKKKGSKASKKDETRIMRAMLNDFDYEVGVYGKEGLKEAFCPAQVARDVISSVISDTTGITSAEAKELAKAHEFSNSEADGLIAISKEFVNTYVETGRKLPLGAREFSDVSLVQVHVEEGTRTYPKKVGENPDGTPVFENREVLVKPHNKIKAESKKPAWL